MSKPGKGKKGKKGMAQRHSETIIQEHLDISVISYATNRDPYWKANVRYGDKETGNKNINVEVLNIFKLFDGLQTTKA
ncbi:MAG: hypothetical protein FWG04_04100 [Desulfovibrionaceae bacterium]|nr:hypothetical protein [Desulfovibrionaceae bacterium]